MTVDDLVAKGAVRDGRPVKVLGTGDIDVKVDVTVHKFSGSAKEKIEAAGGSVTSVTGLLTDSSADSPLVCGRPAPPRVPATRIPAFHRRVFSAGWAAG